MTFIVVEGPEGAGKSTLTRWLTAQLLAEGRRVLTVRQPGGTPIAEAARKLALKSKHEITPAAELFLFLAARADLVDRVVRPALDDGQVVLADRYDLSTLAYQVAGRREDWFPTSPWCWTCRWPSGASGSGGRGKSRIGLKFRRTRSTSGCGSRTAPRPARGSCTSMRGRASKPCRTPPGVKCRR